MCLLVFTDYRDSCYIVIKSVKFWDNLIFIKCIRIQKHVLQFITYYYYWDLIYKKKIEIKFNAISNHNYQLKKVNKLRKIPNTEL